MNWNQEMLKACYPFGSLWWLAKEIPELVEVEHHELDWFGNATIVCRRLHDNEKIMVDAQFHCLCGPVSPLEALGGQAK